jgi:hypothetical protein
MKSATIHDSPTILTLDYFSAIERRLGISWEAQNRPICIPDRFDATALKSLKAELDDILKGDLADKARNATNEYSKEHIQTVGFGLAPDFDQFIKLGFLYGDRVVLWDFLSNRLLLDEGRISKLTLAKTACELLLLKPAVERGAIVILPHPAEWSGLAEMVAEDLKLQGTRSAAVFGLSMALAAVEEGLPLHPFTLLRSELQPKASPVVSGNEGDLYFKENYIFQKAISGMLCNQRFAYLQDVSSAEFQRIVAKHKKLRRTLRKVFSPTTGMSQQQAAIELQQLQSDLANLIEKQNNEILKYATEGSEASAIFTTSLLTTLSAGTIGNSAAAGLCTRLFIALRKWFSRSEKNTIVQAFQALQRQEEREILEVLDEREQRPGIAPSLQVNMHGSILANYNTFQDTYLTDYLNVGRSNQAADDTGQPFKEARARFWAAGPWTEDKHEYLLSLPVELAGKVLKSITSGQRQVLVNHRRFQESYITEYLGDLWEINNSAFWKHVETMFKSPEGLLVGECNGHIEIMCRENMPKYVWMRLLKCLLAIEIKGRTGIGGSFTEMYSEIVLFQTTKATARKQRQLECRNWLQALRHEDRDAMLSFLRKAFNGKVPAWIRL